MLRSVQGVVFRVLFLGVCIPAACSGQTSGGAGDGWPRFRGPEGMGISGATGLPLEWDASKNLVWKTALPGPGASSPITYGGQVYVTCYTGYLVPNELSHAV